MPWDANSFRRKHNQRLSDSQAEKAARIANAILADTGDEELAIRTANARVSGKSQGLTEMARRRKPKS